MKILIINDYLSLAGGAETFMYTLKAALEKKGHEIKIIGSEKGEDISSFFSRWYSVKWYNKTLKVIKKFKPDVVHINNCARIVSPSVIKAALHAKIPVIMTLHDYHYVCPRMWAIDREGNSCECKGWIKSIFSKCRGFKEGYQYFPLHILKVIRIMLHRRVLKKGKIKFISPSNALAKSMKKNLGLNVDVIPNGVDIPSKKADYQKNILFVGRISEENGLQTIINALNKIKKYKVLILGEGYLKKELESKYKNVKFLGFQKPDKYYEKASIALVPSIWKTNAPYSVLEAMAYGLCVIVPNDEGMSEMIKNMKTGLLFNRGNEKDFEKKLNYLIRNPKEIKKMGNNAREFARKNFSWKKIVKGYEKAYLEATRKL